MNGPFRANVGVLGLFPGPWPGLLESALQADRRCKSAALRRIRRRKLTEIGPSGRQTMQVFRAAANRSAQADTIGPLGAERVSEKQARSTTVWRFGIVDRMAHFRFRIMSRIRATPL